METNSPPPEAMWSVSAIANRDRVSKPTVSNHVARLVERHNLTVTRDGRGRVSSVNVVEYDTLRERYADPSKAQAPRQDAPAVPVPYPPPVDNKSYDEATRRRAWLDMEKRRLEVAELRGRLIRADRYGEAVGRCGDELARIVDLLPQEADELAVKLGLDDVHAVRVALKAMARQLRTNLSKAFETLRADAPALDDPIDDLDEEDEGAGG